MDDNKEEGGHGGSRFITVFTVILVVVLVTAGIVVAFQWLRPDPETVLTYETVNIVTVDPDGVIRVPQVAGFAAPSVAVKDGAVPFLLERCNTSGKDLDGVAHTWFVNADGDRFQFSDGTRFTLMTGCAQNRFTLELPREVIVDALDLDDTAPNDSSVWFVQGEFDLDDGGYMDGAWESESFLLVDTGGVVIEGD